MGVSRQTSLDNLSLVNLVDLKNFERRAKSGTNVSLLIIKVKTITKQVFFNLGSVEL